MTKFEGPASHGSASAGLFSTLAADVRVVTADVQKRGFRRTLEGTLEGIEAFYLTDRDRQQLAQAKGIGRFMRRLWWLIKSLLLKLTPARRIMLAIALWFLIVGGQRIEFGRRDFQVNIRLPIISSVMLLTVLMLELKDKLTARNELEAGRAVQLALMPDQSPKIAGWDIWLYTQPANDVGGDLIDHLQIDDVRHGVSLGDVAGKALPAALLSVKLQATLRALVPHFDALGDLGADMNRILKRDGLPDRFASLVYLVVTENSGHIRVLNAGHMPPLVVHGDAITPMERGSVVLGIMPDATFAEQAVDLVSGDTLVVYSDGVSEAMNEAGEFFGEDRLNAMIRQTAGQAPRAIGAGILDSVRTFVGDAVVSDDLSLMILRRC